MGQDVAIACKSCEETYGLSFNSADIQTAVNEHIQTVKKIDVLQKDSPLAKSHGTAYPVVQGPMARITDNPAFAARVAEEGGSAFHGISTTERAEIAALLEGVKKALGDRPWGVGILGFNQEDLLKEQIEALRPFNPPFAIIAGAMPNQISLLESQGTATYAHVVSPDILDMFLAAGAKRFIFEGSECGGHIGPKSSFVLWDTMTERLLEHSQKAGRSDEYHILYAGGIHDPLSASMAAVLSAPLASLACASAS